MDMDSTISPQPLHPLASWVIVGNGPSAARRALGGVIDAHDYVVRFNRYVTGGHESQVGTRTTHWATHGCVWRDEDGRSRQMAPGDGEESPESAILIHGHVPCPIAGIPAYRLRAGIVREVAARLGIVSPQIPTTGIVTLYWLLKDIGVRRLHLVGFDGFSKRTAKNHHYWDPKVYRRPAEHDGDAELRLLRHWSAVGRVAFLSCLAVSCFAF